MATQVQNRRGTTAEHSTFTGAVGELTVDTTKDTVVVHDGAVAGGRPLLREDQSNLPTSAPTTGIYNASGSLAISTGGSGRLFVDASGNVGVGTTTAPPAGHIARFSSFVFAPGFTVNSSGDTGIYSTIANTLQFQTNGSEKVRITSAGLVGVGTSSPAQALDVNGSITTRANGFVRSIGTGSDTVGVGPNTGVGDTGGNAFWLQQLNASRGLDFWNYNAGVSDWTRRLTIDSSGRLGVGTTSPTGIFEACGSSSYFRPTGAAGTFLQITAGAANGDVTLNASANSGNYPPLVFSTGGGEKVRIDSSGRVGIGSSNPGAKLDVSGDVIFNGGSTQFPIQFANAFTPNAQRADLFFSANATSNNALRVGTIASNGGVTLQGTRQTDSSQKVNLVLNPDGGSVGIGTTSPGARLHVAGETVLGDDGSNGRFTVNTNTSRVALLASTTGFGAYQNLEIYGAATIFHRANLGEAARIDSSGRLLVGTSTSTADAIAVFLGRSSAPGGTGGEIKLAHPTTNVPASGTLGRIQFGNTSDARGAEIAAIADSTWATNDYPTNLVFSTTADGASSPTERMRINNEGVVSISSGRLYIQKSDASNPLCYAYNTNNASTDVAYRSELGAGSNGTSAYHFYAVTGGSGKFAIYGNGTYGTISDQRLKTHIETARNGYLDDLNRLNIVKYGWKTDGLDQATELGVIAQEVEQVFPGLIQETPPNEDGEVYKGVKTSVFTFMLIKALQEASAKIETLEAKVAALESA